MLAFAPEGRPMRRLRTDFLLEATVLALARWDRLEPEEQERFRALATKADGHAASNLDATEHEELRYLWKKIGGRKLVRELARRALTRRGTRSPDPA
jgi:hypothetical protein